MEFQTIKIDGVGGIRHVELGFNPKVNIICGPNSIGKTTILECIAHSCSWCATEILKKNALVDEGRVSTTLLMDEESKNISYNIQNFAPQKKDNINQNSNLASQILSIKAIRQFGYTELKSISHDEVKHDWEYGKETESGINNSDLKNWFVNRYLFSDKKEALRQSQIDNFELAKECFSFINPDFRFKSVLAESYDLILETPNGDIYYEYLSSGYKSILFILFGIIKEIEVRFKDPAINARDFAGVILIDEIELHLHPEWQSKIISILTKTFPKAQFFITTHSPHVIQTAAPSQVIPLEEIEVGVLRKKEIAVTEYGFQGWTIEEILRDVMGMEVLRPNRYIRTLEEFRDSVEKNNRKKAEQAYSILCSILHPGNVTRKILEIQLSGVVDEEEMESEMQERSAHSALKVIEKTDEHLTPKTENSTLEGPEK